MVGLRLPGFQNGWFEVVWISKWLLWGCLDYKMVGLRLYGFLNGWFKVAWISKWLVWGCLGLAYNVLQGLRLPGSANGRFVDTIGIKIENRRLGFLGFCN